MTLAEAAVLFGGGLAPATVIGGFSGARLTRRLPAEALRWTIVAFRT
ncbi:hypothetical protein GCM10010168_72470 [Actinoplanes ianthinogenes]|uniref:Uncharacterized protein n=1 Tax=Actinoplanes ianthinogenes TaxID=122358 RepID=A0ABM7M691_9ACTN|nr:hypothetical protein [Actinoplanes ianthinogenes]BCJ47164.1 hypothetical protein Aiant_78210 [Actinoplanes ianthinogenes]GGR42959.1 hypothetical protein GCM10010168_72470 [Actinoplanes ianthinogenes]